MLPKGLINLRDVPLNEDGRITPWAYDKCVGFLDKYFGHKSVARYGVAFGARNDKEKDFYLECSNTVCHAEWYHGPYGRSEDYKAPGFLIATAFNKPGNKTVEKYLDFFVRESIWSRFILNKDDTDCNTKGIIVDASLPKGLVQMMNIICRTPREHPGCAEIWNLLVKGGLDPNAALYMAWAFNEPAKHGGNIFWSLRGHTWGSPSVWTRESLDLLGKGFAYQRGLIGAPSTMCDNVHSGSGKSLQTLFNEAVEDAKNKGKDKKETVSSVTNPFAPQAPRNTSSKMLNMGEFVEYFIPLILIKKEKLNVAA